MNGTVAVPAVQANAVPEPKVETPNLPVITQATGDSKDGPMPEAQKSGGFFKRLFGKFK